MSTGYVNGVTEAIGGTTYALRVLANRCDQCGATYPKDGLHDYGPPFVKVEDTGQLCQHRDTSFCSWACLAVYAASKATKATQ